MICNVKIERGSKDSLLGNKELVSGLDVIRTKTNMGVFGGGSGVDYGVLRDSYSYS